MYVRQASSDGVAVGETGVDAMATGVFVAIGVLVTVLVIVAVGVTVGVTVAGAPTGFGLPTSWIFTVMYSDHREPLLLTT